MVETISIAMLSEREQELLRALIDARAMLQVAEREYREAEQRASEAQAALTEFYGNADPGKRMGLNVRVQITGISGATLREAGEADLSERARETIAAMPYTEQGFGARFRLVAPREVAEEIAEFLDKKASEASLLRTKKGRADAASLSESARRIRQALIGA